VQIVIFAVRNDHNSYVAEMKFGTWWKTGSVYIFSRLGFTNDAVPCPGIRLVRG